MNPSPCKHSLTLATLFLSAALLIALGMFGSTDFYHHSVTGYAKSASIRTAASSPAAATAPDMAIQARIGEDYGRLPMSFEANQGQTNARAKFLARGNGYSLYLTPSEAVLSLKMPIAQETGTKSLAAHRDDHTGMAEQGSTQQNMLRMKLVNANPSPRIAGLDELPGKSNYLIGNDPKRWRTNVAHYAKVKYEAVYRGVDLVYYGNQRQLEYDFIVAPEANPAAIRLAFDDARAVEIDAAGDLVLQTRGGEVRQRKPFIYQETGGERREVAGRYVRKGKRQVSFEVGEYDKSAPLIIDPVLVYSTYLGGSGDDDAFDIAVDAAGNAYVTGYTLSTSFPTTAGAADTTYNGGPGGDVFVSKLNASGTALVYSTFLGGSESDEGHDIAVDAAGNAYVTGFTLSTNFPTTPGAFDNSYNGAPVSDVFVTKLDTSGSALVYSTYLGGSGGSYGDHGHGIALDGAGNVYVTGSTDSPNYPTTPDAFDTSLNTGVGLDAFVTKLNASGSALIYSTFLGGSGGTGNGVNGGDVGYDIAVDTAGNAYVIGPTVSSNLPTTPGAFDTTFNGSIDAFVMKLNASGASLVYSTYLGGNGFDVGYSIAVDGTGNAYVTGQTNNLGNFPTTPGAYDTTSNGGYDAFVTKLNTSGSGVIYSTFLGGNNNELGYAIAVDVAGSAYVTGYTNALNFPTTPDALDTSYSGGLDGFLTKLDATGAELLYSTYLDASGTTVGQGIDVDAAGNVYVTGNTTSDNLPATSGAFDTSYNNGYDAFIIKIFLATPTPQIVNGKIAFYSFRDGNYEIYVINADGTGEQRVTTNPAADLYPAFSRDGSKIAFSRIVDGNNQDIFIINADGTGERRLTVGEIGAMTPAFSPDGSKVAFRSQRPNTPHIYVINVDGTGEFRLTTNSATESDPVFSPDGNKIAFTSSLNGSNDIYIINVDGTGEQRLTTNIGSDRGPSFSPDGSRIVFSSNVSGNNDIYIINVDGTGEQRLTTTVNGDTFHPSFSPDGSKIAFGSSGNGNSGDIYTINADGTGKQQVTTNPAVDIYPSWGSACANGSSSSEGLRIDGGPPLHPNGTLVKVSGNDTVYLIWNGQKREITSESVLSNLYQQSNSDFRSSVITVAADELSSYPDGQVISSALPSNGRSQPDGRLIKNSAGEISIVTNNGRRRPFSSGTVFTQLGYAFCDAVLASDYDSYTVGTVVDGREALPTVTSSISLSPSGPYNVNQSITASFSITNNGNTSITFSQLLAGGRLGVSATADFPSQLNITLTPNQTYFYQSSRSFSSGGSYQFFPAFQNQDGTWRISLNNEIGIAPGVVPIISANVNDETAPTATTGSAANVTGTTAQLNGTANPNGSATNAWFEWGTSSDLSSFDSTPQQSIGSGITASSVNASLSGLASNTTYYYRLAASNSAGTTRGTISSFTTTTPTTNVQVTVQTSPAGRSFSVDGTVYSSAQTFTWTSGSAHTISTTSPQSGAAGTQYLWANWNDGGAISHTVTPTASATYTANFTTQYFLTVNAGSGGTVSPASGWYNAGQTVSISATPNSGNSFNGWSGIGAGSYTGISNPANVTMNGPIIESAGFTPLVNVTWTNAIGVSISGNTLTKTTSSIWGNAGASSAQALANGDGYMEYTATTNTEARLAGLSRGDTDQNWQDVDFAIDPANNGQVYIYEGGVARGVFGSYAAGDRFRVAVEGGVVKYYRNSVLLYTSGVAPTYPLLVDTALYGTGVTVSDAVLAGSSIQTISTMPVENVSWANIVGVITSGNTLTKTASSIWGNAGASSTRAIASGDGYMEFTATTNTEARLAGLSQGDTDQNWQDVDFAIDPANNGQVYIYEAGISRGVFGSYVAGDRFKVAIENGVVKYYKNNVLLYTGTMTPTYPLLVDTALYSTGVTISDTVIAGSSIQTISTMPVENVSWANVVGVIASGNTLTKTSPSVWGNAGASSTRAIASGDGYMEFTATTNTEARLAGLSRGDTDQNWQDVDFAIDPANNGQVYIYEAGVARGVFGSYAAGDRFRVAVEGGVVKYYRNSVLLYTSGVAPTYPLLVDTALYGTGVTVSDTVIAGSLQ